MLVVVIVSLLVFYVFIAAFKNERVLTKSATKAFRRLAIVLSLIVFGIFVLAQSNYYLRGYWTPRIIFWLWFFCLVTLYGFGARSVLTKLERGVCYVITFLPLVIAAAWIVPFLGVALSIAWYPSLIGDSDMVVFADQNMRVEVPYVRFLGPDPPLEIFKKSTFFSRKVAVVPIQFNSKTDSIFVERSADSVTISYHTRDNWDYPQGKGAFTYKF